MKDFISISKLLDAISERIPLPDQRESFINLPAAPPDFSFFKAHPPSLVQLTHRLNNWQIQKSFSYAYRLSLAARGLDADLANHAEHCPAWYDTRDTGVPKKNSDCQKIVEAILVHIANSFEQKLVFYRRTGLQLMHYDAPKLYAHADDEQRLKQVGFSSQDVHNFFEKTGIENPFQDAKLDHVAGADVDAADQSDTTPTKQQPSRERKIHSTKEERGNLIAGFIEEIIAEIQDDDPSTVFRHLRIKAEQSGSPFIEVTDGYIEYEDNNGKFKRLNVKALRSRISRRRERLAKPFD